MHVARACAHETKQIVENTCRLNLKLGTINHLKAGIRIALMAHIANYNEIKLAEGFMRFKKTIKKCTEIAYQWQPNDICVKGRNCYKVTFTKIRFLSPDTNSQRKQKQTKSYRNTKNLEQADCLCPNNKPYACGSQDGHCSLNKEACDSFGLLAKSKEKQITLSDIKKCDNDFNLIG